MLDERSKKLRRTIVRIIELAGRAHVGSAFSLIEILRVLYDDVMKYDPKNPRWADRDRFILSKGHGCLALYTLLAEKGFFPEDELWRFCQKDSILGGHPEYGKVPGVEASTGSLGHGLSIGIGMALALRYEKNPARVFVVIGDGESNEGSIWEGALSAAKHSLSNLTVIVDYNSAQAYGSSRHVMNLEPLAKKWESFGFAVAEIDGHSVGDLRKTLTSLPLNNDKPTTVICRTTKGKGVPLIENNASWHHKTMITPQELKDLLSALEAS